MKSIHLHSIMIGCLILFAHAAIKSAPAAFAQTLEDDLSEFVQLSASDIRNLTKNIVSGVMDFTEEEGNAFWPVYEKYETEYDKISDRMQAVIEDYQANRDTMNDKKAKELAESTFSIDEEKIRLQEKYYKEFCEVIAPKRATQLFQVLRRIDLLINLKIAATLPIIGEDW